MTTRRSLDPELAAAQKVTTVLAELPVHGQMRVLRYCLERAYEQATGTPARVTMPPQPQTATSAQAVVLDESAAPGPLGPMRPRLSF